MNKVFILFTLISALFVSAFATVTGMSGVFGPPILLFPFLSLVVPLFVKKMTMNRVEGPFRLNMWYHTYSWAWWTLFSLLHTLFSAVSDSSVLTMLLQFGVFFLVQILIELTGLLLTLFFERRRRFGIIEEAVDMCVYILPLPFLYIGSILYVDLKDPVMQYFYAASININIVMAEFVLLILTMLVFVFYMYPRQNAYKSVRLLRIFVTAMMWLAMNGHVLYGGYIPEFVKALVPVIFPTYQGNALVFFTPAVVECAFIVMSVLIGYWTERGILKVLTKKNNHF